jgi:hypothetical protein
VFAATFNQKRSDLNLCDTADGHDWHIWSQALHRWGIGDWAASLLEAAGPLTLLGAQAIYITGPLLRSFTTEDNLNVMARLLEEPDLTQAFARYLREDASREPA